MQWASVLDGQHETIDTPFVSGSESYNNFPFPLLTSRSSDGLNVSGLYMDLSGDLLSELHRMRTLTPNEPKTETSLDTRIPTLDDITIAFKTLKGQGISIQKEQTDLEDKIRCLSSHHTQLNDTLHSLICEVASTNSLSIEEYGQFQTVIHEFRKSLKTIVEKPQRHLQLQLMAKNEQSINVSQSLTVYQSFLKVAATELFGNEIKPNTCVICYENTISEALIPCGHTFCSKCIQKTHTSSNSIQRVCMTCRAAYTNKIKIYL